MRMTDDLNEIADRIRLKRRFEDLAEDVLPGEGFPDEEITNAMVRALCERVDDKARLLALVDEIATIWFEHEP